MKKTRIAVLTSSRADYGIYQPLLRRLEANVNFDLRLIVFGTHLSKQHGYTFSEIEKDGYAVDYKLDTMFNFEQDDEFVISKRMALTSGLFSDVWNKSKNNYDLVICLGDRYEMFAAVLASVPFNIKIVHIHGGETSLGAIDNKFRHSLSIFSDIHFTATDAYSKRVIDIIGSDKNVYTTGALSLDNLKDISFLEKTEFLEKFDINLDIPSVLVTFHPETVEPYKNQEYALELVKALKCIDKQIIITMPNSDTMGLKMREIYLDFANSSNNVKIIEHFGIIGYFTCMKNVDYLIGNTSSGIIEAASFGKYVINVGNRQLGRHCSKNTFHSKANCKDILELCYKIEKMGTYTGENDYYKTNVSEKMISLLNSIND